MSRLPSHITATLVRKKTSKKIPFSSKVQLAIMNTTLLASSPTTKTKRRYSHDEPTPKKQQRSKLVSIDNTNDQKHIDQLKNQYPVFHHPDGGFIQFTPNGNIRTIFQDNKQISIVETSSSFDLAHIDKGIDGYSVVNQDKFNVATNNSSNPSPSNEIEAYMREGYNNSKYYYLDSENDTANKMAYYFNDDDEDFSDYE